MCKCQYIIRNSQQDYWSNILGWTEYRKEASKFTTAQMQTCPLPLDAIWEKIEDEK